MDFRPRSAHPKLVAGQARRSFDLFKLRTEHEQLSLVSVYIILSPILTISINAFALKRQSRVLFLDQRVELFFEQIPFDASSRRFIYFSRNSFKRFFRFSPVKSFIEALTFFQFSERVTNDRHMSASKHVFAARAFPYRFSQPSYGKIVLGSAKLGS